MSTTAWFARYPIYLRALTDFFAFAPKKLVTAVNVQHDVAKKLCLRRPARQCRRGLGHKSVHRHLARCERY